MKAVACGREHSVGIDNYDRLIQWGDMKSERDDFPKEIKVKAIACSDQQSLAIKEDDTMVQWGNKRYGERENFPSGIKVKAIACGTLHSVAIKEDGTMVQWGDTGMYQQDNFPSGIKVKAIACGEIHSVAIKEDDTLVQWGPDELDDDEELDLRAGFPAGVKVKAIACGGAKSVAIKEDDTLIQWGPSEGPDDDATLDFPVGVKVKAVTCNFGVFLAIKEDDTMVQWGSKKYGQRTNFPAGIKVKAIAVAAPYCVAIKEDGSLIQWGLAPPPIPILVPPYAGYTKSDAEIFNQIFEEPNEWSNCPVCLAYVRRSDGCMYMRHTCDPAYRHEQLFKTFKDTRYKAAGEIEWCTICGRASLGHKHFALSLPTATTLPPFAPITQGAPAGALIHFDYCIQAGGGGVEEKIRRVHRLLSYACELQDEVGKISATEAKTELVEEVWKAPLSRNRAVPKMLAAKKFDFPCVFPDDTVGTTSSESEAEAPDVLRPADERELTPVKTEDHICYVKGEAHDDNRDTYVFRHKQIDGHVVDHDPVCGEDLEMIIKSSAIDGTCRLDPTKCKALMYPEELKGIVSPEFEESYRKLFNKARQQGRGRKRKGGAPQMPLLIPVNLDEATCAPPPKPKKAGRRRTYKKRKVMRGKSRKVIR